MIDTYVIILKSYADRTVPGFSMRTQSLDIWRCLYWPTVMQMCALGRDGSPLDCLQPCASALLGGHGPVQCSTLGQGCPLWWWRWECSRPIGSFLLVCSQQDRSQTPRCFQSTYLILAQLSCCLHGVGWESSGSWAALKQSCGGRTVFYSGIHQW